MTGTRKLKMTKQYYKIVASAPLRGTIIDTDDTIDLRRIARYSELTKLFDLIFNCSSNHNQPVGEILFLINANFVERWKYNFQNRRLKSEIKKIRRESFRRKFNINLEFRWFNDFVLEKAKRDIEKEQDVILPDRFKSSYFLESIDDCQVYYENLGFRYDCQIIKVEFIETRELRRFDNYFLVNFQNYFSSNDFYNQAKDFLNEKKTETPLIEIIFQGKYRVIDSYGQV